MSLPRSSLSIESVAKDTVNTTTIIHEGPTYHISLIDSTTVLKYIPTAPLPSSNPIALETLTNAAKIHSLIPPHPHILTFKSFSPQTGLHLEYIPNGSITKYLSPPNSISKSSSSSRRTPAYTYSPNIFSTTHGLLSWSQQVTLGLAHIHKNGIIHGNIVTDNILLAKNLGIKISGFGSGRLLCSSDESENGNEDENKEINKIAIQSDIFALGTVIYHFITGHPPFPNLKISEATSKLKAGDFPVMNSIAGCGSVVYKCWAGIYGDVGEVVRDLDMCVEACWGDRHNMGNI